MAITIATLIGVAWGALMVLGTQYLINRQIRKYRKP